VLAKFISEIHRQELRGRRECAGQGPSIISPTKVTPEHAYSIFQSVLQVKGFTTVQAGSIVRSFPSRDVRNRRS